MLESLSEKVLSVVDVGGDRLICEASIETCRVASGSCGIGSEGCDVAVLGMCDALASSVGLILWVTLGRGARARRMWGQPY